MYDILSCYYTPKSVKNKIYAMQLNNLRKCTMTFWAAIIPQNKSKMPYFDVIDWSPKMYDTLFYSYFTQNQSKMLYFHVIEQSPKMYDDILSPYYTPKSVKNAIFPCNRTISKNVQWHFELLLHPKISQKCRISM